MEKMKKERLKAEQKKRTHKIFMDNFNPAEHDAIMGRFVNLKWPQYILASVAIIFLTTLSTFPMFRYIAECDNMGQKKDAAMQIWFKQANAEDRRFQLKLLNNFRTKKDAHPTNVTDDDLRNSTFFN